MKFLVVAIALACCGAHGKIARDASAVRAFKSSNHCPSTGRARGACPGWEVDHAIPLCAGGSDTPDNMQWLRVDDHKFKTRVDVRECRRMQRQ